MPPPSWPPWPSLIHSGLQGLWYVTCVKLWNIYMPLVVSRCTKFLVANGRFLGWWQSFMDLVLFRRFSNWWQLKHFVIFTPYILGVSWSQFDKNKSNHQLVIFRRCFFSTKKYTTPIWYANFPMGHFWYLTRSRGGTVFFWWNRWKKDVWHETLGKMCSAASMLRNREFRTLSSLNSMNPWS